MEIPRISLAIAHYDRHVPLLDGTVQVPNFDLDVKEVSQSGGGRDGQDRHGRMLRDQEFDAAEVSLSSYLITKDAGAPFTAIPVIPRRLFSQGLFLVPVGSPLRGPEDLADKRVGLQTYQTTLSVLAKGDLQHEHGISWKSITWVLTGREALPFDPPPDVHLEEMPAGRKIEDLLLGGDIDAAIMPHFPSSLLAKRDQIRQLFPNAREAEEAYYRRNGYWPAMHVVALRQDVADTHPELPRALFNAFEQAKQKTLWHYEDPNWSLLTWSQSYLEEEQKQFGRDPWPNGVSGIRANLERFMQYSQEQGLIRTSLSMDQLFHPSVLNT